MGLSGAFGGSEAGGWSVGGAGKSFVVRRRHLLSPQAFADPRLAYACATKHLD
jgi:hypothetical protein